MREDINVMYINYCIGINYMHFQLVSLTFRHFLYRHIPNAHQKGIIDEILGPIIERERPLGTTPKHVLEHIINKDHASK